MKKRYVIIAAFMLAVAIPLIAAAQQRLVRLTRYEGDRITGVLVGSGFDVHLVQSDETKAVVEIDENREHLLNMSLSPDGILTVGIRSENSRRIRFSNNRNQTQKLTVYLPTLERLRASGGTTVHTTGTFTAERANIEMQSGAELKGLDLRCGTLDFSVSGASQAVLTGQAREARVQFRSGSNGRINLKSDRIRLEVSSASEANLTGECADFEAKLSSGSNARVAIQTGTAVVECSGASELTLSGAADNAKMTASSGSKITATAFAVKKVNVTASGASDTRVWAIDELTGKASSGSSIRYKGDPPVFNTESGGGSSVRKIN